MNNTQAWEEYYLQNYDFDEYGPVSVEEINQMWIEMREKVAAREGELDWIKIIYGDADPISTVMSVRELNEFYVQYYVGVESAEIKQFPTFNAVSEAQRKLA